MENKNICLDTSVIINGILSNMIKEGKIKNCKIVIPKAVISELENQANKGKQIGYEGIEELKRIVELSKEHNLKIEYIGKRPSLDDVVLAKSGCIDAIIREIAKETKSVLFTSDYIQYNLAIVEGIETKYFETEKPEIELEIIKFFDDKTMSIHLKEECYGYAKKGKPGEFKLIKITEKEMKKEDLELLIDNIIKYTEQKHGLIEIDKYGAMVIQLGDLRITITKPPFSERIEITAVRPTKKMSLNDYDLSEKIFKKLEKAEGILIAGPPGSGKSTFASALAEYYKNKGKIVKTIENPRDLQVSKEITQYTLLENNLEHTCDILLLVRPDYTIYDEIRKTKDFEIYTDMRLAGVGMIGVVHASKPIDAIQRMIGRVELGVIPQVIDTIIFMEKGTINKIYEIDFVVKVPFGMEEKDLARPVIIVRDFKTGIEEYEIYSYGEEIVVMPLKQTTSKPVIYQYAREKIREILKKHLRNINFDVDVVSKDRINLYISKREIPKIIGKSGERIKELEEYLGLNIDVVELKEDKTLKIQDYEIIKNNIILKCYALKGKNARLIFENETIGVVTFNSKGEVKINKKSKLGKKILKIIKSGYEINIEKI